LGEIGHGDDHLFGARAVRHVRLSSSAKRIIQ
jgi:hypothetical protein